MDWSDKEQVRKSEWMYGFKTAAKKVLSVESQGFDGVIDVICILGGPITQVEAVRNALTLTLGLGSQSCVYVCRRR